MIINFPLIVGLWFILCPRKGICVQRRSQNVCSRSLGLYDGAIDKDQIVYSSYLSNNDQCNAKNGGRMDTSLWCANEPKGKTESMIIRFHQPVMLTGIFLKFQNKPQKYGIKYFPTVIDDLTWLQTAFEHTLVAGEGDPSLLKWLDAPLRAQILMIEFKETSSKNLKVEIQLYGCPYYDTARPLLTATNINTKYANVIDSEGVTDFYRQLLPDTSGSGWALTSPLSTPQLTETVDTNWVQVTFNSVHNIHYILMQQKRGDGSLGKYWIKYGLEDTALNIYQWNDQTKVIEPPDFKLITEKHYHNTSHVFPEPLIAKVLRVVPICDGSTSSNECSMIKVQLYGFPRLIPDHYWDFEEARFSDNYGNIDGSSTPNFISSGFRTVRSSTNYQMLKSDPISRNECLVNPDKCNEGFSLSMSSKVDGVPYIVLYSTISNELTTYRDDSGSCVKRSSSSVLAFDRPVYMRFRCQVTPYSKLANWHYRIVLYSPQGGRNGLKFKADLFIQAPSEYAQQCRDDIEPDATVEVTTNYRSNNAIYIGGFDKIFQKFVQTSNWLNVDYVILKVTPVEDNDQFLSIAGSMVLQEHYFPVCLGYDKDAISYLEYTFWSATCNTGAHALFIRNGWDACKNGELKIDLVKRRVITSLRVAGKKDSASVLSAFQLHYSMDGTEYFLFGSFTRKYTTSGNLEEYLPLERPLMARHIKIIAAGEGGLRFGVVECKSRDYEPRSWVKLSGSEVCAGSRDENPGRFNALLDFEATYYKLVHTRGKVCEKNWGCSGNAQTMVITNSNRELLSRPGGLLYRHSVENPEMIIQGRHPVMIKANDELNVWYNNDFMNSNEQAYSSDEQICFDVYAYGKRYPHHNVVYNHLCEQHFGLRQCPCFGLSYPYLHTRGSCQDLFYFTVNFELVYADTGQCLVPTCTVNGCRIKLSDCDGSSNTKYWHDSGKGISHRDSGKCFHRSHHRLDDDSISLYSVCENSLLYITLMESEGYQYTDDTMYAETREMTKNDMTAFCKTKWDGHGHLAHFFSQIEYERLRFYVQYRVSINAYTFLPIQQGNFRSYNYLLSDDKTKIFNYLPWRPGYPTEHSRYVYIYKNYKLFDHVYNDTPVICQKQVDENMGADFKPLPSFPPSHWDMPIVAGGLERLGTESYTGKGFYVGFLWSTTIIFAVQGQFGLYEGTATAPYQNWHDWTLIYNKTEGTVKFYIKGVFMALAKKIHSVPCEPLPVTYSDYLVIGSRFSYYRRIGHVMFADIKFWKHPLTEDELIESYTKLSILFDDEHDEAAKSTAYSIQSNCIDSKDTEGLCYDAGQFIRGEHKVAPVTYSSKAKPAVMRSMNVSNSEAITCGELNPVLGVLAPATLSASKTFMQYKIEILKSNVLILSAKLKFQVHSASATALRFSINIYGDNIAENTDCTTYSSQRLDFGSSMEFEVASASQSPSTPVDVEVGPLVQRVVNRNDWNEKKIVTFVLSVQYGTGAGVDKVVFHDTSNCLLIVDYRDFFPNKYMVFHQNKKFESYITSPVFTNAKSLAFWYWVSGSDAGQLIVWKSYAPVNRRFPSRGGSSLPIVTITNDQGQGWKQARINLMPESSLMKLEFLVLNSFGKNSSMAIDNIEFGKTNFPEENITTEVLPSTDYEAINSYKIELARLNITLPIIFFPFTSVSWTKDYSVNEFTLSILNLYFKYVRDWFDCPGGALQSAGSHGSNPRMSVVVGNVTTATSNVKDEFTILFHMRPIYLNKMQTIFHFGDGYSSSFELYQEKDSNRFKLNVTSTPGSWQIIQFPTGPVLNQWNYIGLRYKNPTLEIIINEKVTHEANVGSITIPDSLHFFRDPLYYDVETSESIFRGTIGCFQVYNEYLSLFHMELLKLCPTMHDSSLSEEKDCAFGGVSLASSKQCVCSRKVRFSDGLCKNGLASTTYENALVYLSFDYEDYSEKSNFVYSNYTSANQCPSILNTGYCCQEAECHIGDLNDDCLVGGRCPGDTLISFWYHFSGGGGGGGGGNDQFPNNDEVVVLKIGHLQMSVRYDSPVGLSPQASKATGFIQWVEGTCKYSFIVPVMSWVHISILFKDNTMALSFNGQPFSNVEADCVLSSLSAGTLSNKFTVGYLIVDEFSLFMGNEAIPDLYTTLITGNINTNEVLYQKHFTILVSIETADIRSEDVSMINIGLKNADFFNVQNMINEAISSKLTEESNTTGPGTRVLATDLLSLTSQDPVVIEAACSFEYFGQNVWDSVGVPFKHNERYYKGIQILDSTSLGGYVQTTDVEYDIVHANSSVLHIRFNFARRYHHGYNVHVIVHNMDPELPPITNETRFFHHGLSVIAIEELHPSRKVSLTLSIISHFGYAKAVTKETETLQDVNLVAPFFQNATVMNSTSIVVNWYPYPIQNWNGKGLEFVLRWKELEPIMENEYRNSVNVSGGEFMTYASGILPTSHLLNGLNKYANYSIELTTRNQMGVSDNYTEVICATLEDAPDASPTNISSLAVKSTSITLTMSPPGKRWVNGIILGYQVTYWTSEDEAVSKNFTRTRSENETRGEISGLRKFFNHNITVKAFTRIGLGPLSDVIVVKTGEDVPTEPPTNFSILAVSHVELALSWKDIPVLSTHGIMRNFTISCNGTLANQSLHRRDKVIVYPVAAGITQHSYNMTDLYPYTVYNCTVQGCTTPGCGPTVEKSQQTLEYYPGFVQSINQTTHEEKEALYINYDILPMEKHGAITHFNISMNKLENPWDNVNDTTQYFRIPSNVLSWSATGLDNYTEYFITITAYTSIGPGPTRNATFRTATNVPSLPPSLYYVNNISSSALNVKWNLLEDQWINGPLPQAGYTIYFRLTDEHELCDFYNNCTLPNSTFVNASTSEVNLYNLELNRNYTVWMVAQTEAGSGPKSLSMTAITDYFINGNWTVWTEWGSCDQSCGLGYIRRWRWCTNPAPFAGGTDCEGDSIEALPCNNFTCPAYYLAEESVDCEDTCKQVNESYACFNQVNTRESYAIFETSRDPSNYTREMQITCNGAASADSAKSRYSKTFHPSYDTEAGRCDGYVMAPLKINCTAEENIDEKTRRLCYCIDTETMGYEEWASWSPCTKPCGKGSKTRFRNCLLEVGCGKTRDIQDCNIFQCPINGQWSAWSKFTQCTKTCGFGQQTRTRSCNNPPPQHDGEFCVGTGIDLIEGCNPYPCPIHGNWGEWIKEDFCTQPCGPGGFIPFKRYCDSPKPKYRGRACPGLNHKSEPCNEHIVCNKSISVTFVVKLVDREWHYSMVYKNQPKFINTQDDLAYAVQSVMNESSVGIGNIEAVRINDLSRGSVITNFSIIYHQIPNIELLVMQEAIDNIGKIDTLNITFINVASSDVPSNPPAFTAISRTPFSIDVDWGGNMSTSTISKGYTYYVYYRHLKGNQRNWTVFGTRNMTARLNDLVPGSLYGIRVSISTAGSKGVASIEQEVWTGEGVPYIAPPNFELDVIDHETVFLNWQNIGPQHVPGTLSGYVITYRKYHENQTNTIRLTSTSRTLKGLKPNTLYWIEVAGYTISGNGPEVLNVFTTPKGPPGVFPPNLKVDDRYSTQAVNVSWDAIPKEQENGYLVGYKIAYQLVRQSGTDVPVGTPIHTLTFDRFVFWHEITGLEAYAEYKIEVYGYAHEGDGPRDEVYAVTCTCPPTIYTNYLVSPPYTELIGSRGNTTLTGIFPKFLEMIIDAVCTGCRSYQKSEFVYNQTLTGHPSQKLRPRDVKLQIVGSHLSFPLFGRFDVEMFQGQYPYVGIVQSQGSALIVPIVKVKTVGLMGILRAISNAWPVMSVAVLIAYIVGWLFWFFEQPSEETEISRDRSIVGSLQGLWLAYTTMTTVGYGDFTPSNKLSQFLMLFWILAGLVVMGLVTGVIASGMTVGDISEEIKLYGTKTAVLHGSFENGLAIRRNAKVDNSKNYTKIIEVLESVRDKIVEIGLVDATAATDYEEDFKRLELRVHKVIDSGSGYGVVLSSGLEVIAADVKSYVSTNRPFINEFVKQNVPILYPKKHIVKSELISSDEVMGIGIYMGYIFAGLCFFGISLWICRMRKKVKIEPVSSLTIFPGFDKLVKKFADDFNENTVNLALKQEKDLLSLVDLRKKYMRLANRIGYRTDVVNGMFDKQRKKTLRQLKKKQYAEKLKIYAENEN